MRHWLPFLLTFAIAYPLSLIGLDIHHDGVILKPALDVWSGQTLFLDSFSQYGPLTTWIQALFMKVLGPNLYALKVSAAIFYSLSAVTLAALWRHFLSERWVWIGLAIWILLAPYVSDSVLLPWPSVYALFFQTLSAVCLIQAIKKESWFALFSGASAAAVFWCRQPVGLLTIAGFSGVLLLYFSCGFRQRKRCEILGGFFLGLGVVFGSVLFHLFLAGSLPYWFEQNIAWPALWAKSTGGTTVERVFFFLVRIRNESIVLLFLLFAAKGVAKVKPCLAPAVQWTLALIFGAAIFFRFPLSIYQAGIFTLMPLTGLLIAGPALSKNPSWTGFIALVLVITSWAQFYPVNDSWHVYWAVSPMIGIFIYWVSEWLKNQFWLKAFFSLWLLSLLVTQVPGSYRKLTAPYTTLEDSVLAGIKLPVKRAEALKPLLVRLRSLSESHGERPILLEGVDPFYAALTTALVNAHRMPMIWRAGNLLQTHFDPLGFNFIEKNHPYIISQLAELRIPGLPAALQGYTKDLTLIDPDRGTEVTLWVPKIIFQ